MILEKLPWFISHFLGYRKPSHVPKSLPLRRVLFWSFLAAWIGIALLEIMFSYSPLFQSHHAPMIIASFGAGAVLIYGVPDSPLAQPRNVICGQFIGSLMGVIMAQLFLNIRHDWSPAERVAVEWIGGATAMALTLTVMQITKTVHPPGGATALIAVTTQAVVDISWYYIAIVTLSAVMQVIVCCFITNVERRYPLYWWTPQKPIQVDSTTLSTVMPFPDNSSQQNDKDSSIIMEEGKVSSGDKESLTVRKNSISASSSCTTVEVTNAVEQAIMTLQKYADISHIKYALISPGSPIYTSPGLFNDSQHDKIAQLIQNLDNSNNNQV